MSEPLLSIPNHHTAACGDPPFSEGHPTNCYLGYFENRHGEQWVFVMDRSTHRATLRGGDVGWHTELKVRNGTVEDLNLTPEEQFWLQACWNAAQKQLSHNRNSGD